jgi:hypothetical protein
MNGRRGKISNPKLVAGALALTLLSIGTACKSTATPSPVDAPDTLIVVDCMLPGQQRKLGGKMSYMGPRRPARLPAGECEKLGGEYVASDRANYSTALKVWLPLAQDGDSKAQVYVGEIYEKGVGSQPDYAQAATWYEKAAGKGDTNALYHSAFLYEQGLGVNKDPVRALNLYRQAAGLKKGNDLTYAADVTIAQQAAQVKIDALTAELEERDRAGQKLTKSLEDTEHQLREKQSVVDRLRRDEAMLRSQLRNLQATPKTSGNRAELDKLKAALDEKQRTLTAQGQELDTLKKSSTDQNAELRSRLAEAQTQETALQSQLGNARAQVDELGNQLAAAQARAQTVAQESANLREKIKAGESKLSAAQEVLQRQQTFSTAADRRRMQELQSQLLQQQVELERQQSVADNLQTQKQDLNAEVQRLQSSLEKSKGDQSGNGESISTLRATLASLNADLLRVTQEKSILTAQLESASRQLSADSAALRDGAAALGAKRTELDRKNTQLAEQDTSIVSMRAQLAAVEATSKGDRQLITDYQDKLNKLAITRSPPVGAAISVGDAHSKQFALGTSLALVIGNSKYDRMPQLQTAEKDADDVATVLAERYGFKGHIKTLHSARRQQMIEALYEIVKAAGDQDSLIIYYAGHGALDETTHRSYWLPVDSNGDNPSNWISDSDITSWVSETKAKHVLIVADSCYSGAMTRASAEKLATSGSPAAEKARLMLIAKLRSRTVLTSGGVAPVLDGGPDGNSIFAHEFVDLLKQNTQVLEVTSLYSSLADRVRMSAMRVGELTGKKIEQIPQIAWIQDAGHQQGGEFLFVPVIGNTTPRVASLQAAR